MALLAAAPLALMLATPAAPAPDAAEQDAIEHMAQIAEDQPAPPAPGDTPPTIAAMAASAERDGKVPSAQEDADDSTQVEPDPAANLANPDPFEPVNRVFFAISQPIDTFIFRPIALIYKALLPEPVRDGIHNALTNIFTPTVLANDILQLRPRRAGRTLARFAINSTLGVGGLFDMARRKPFEIAGHPNNLSDTLGVAGAGPGVYFYLPLMGPTSFRDLIGMVGDTFTQPLLLDRVYHTQVATVNRRSRSFITGTFALSTQGIITLAVAGVDARARADAGLQALKKQSVDVYASLRASYMQNRAGEIAMLKAKDGAQAEVPAFQDPLTDPDPAPAKPASAPPAPAPAGR